MKELPQGVRDNVSVGSVGGGPAERGSEGAKGPLEVRSTTGLDAARDMLSAARHSRALAFAHAKNAWEESGPQNGPLADAVQRLRDAWYHDGSQAARLECKRAIAELGRAVASNQETMP
jgi:hypothetical protein